MLVSFFSKLGSQLALTAAGFLDVPRALLVQGHEVFAPPRRRCTRAQSGDVLSGPHVRVCVPSRAPQVFAEFKMKNAESERSFEV